MWDIFKAFDEINNSIFQHKDSDSKKELPEKPTSNPPLKSAPRPTENNNNDPFDFFATIFNLCSVERSRKNIKKTPETQSPKTHNDFVSQNLPDRAKNEEEIRIQASKQKINLDEQESFREELDKQYRDYRLYKIYNVKDKSFICFRVKDDSTRVKNNEESSKEPMSTIFNLDQNAEYITKGNWRIM
jgi:hypothetical protein